MNRNHYRNGRGPHLCECGNVAHRCTGGFWKCSRCIRIEKFNAVHNRSMTEGVSLAELEAAIKRRDEGWLFNEAEHLN